MNPSENRKVLLSELLAKANALFSENENSFSGLTVKDVSIDEDLREKRNSKTYGGYVYLNGSGKNGRGSVRVSIRIKKEILEAFIGEYPKDYPLSGKSYDVLVDSVSLSSGGNLVIKTSSLSESGLSERELFLMRLDAYCKEKGYYERKKRSLRFPIRRILALTSPSSTIETDILNNAGLKKELITVKKVSRPEDMANLVREAREYDLVVLFRGGREDRALRDLFYSEPLIDAVAKSEVPVASALGHEIDIPFISRITDTDYSTPSAFAKEVKSGNLRVFEETKETRERAKETLRSLFGRKAEGVGTLRNGSGESLSSAVLKKAAALRFVVSDSKKTLEKIETSMEKAMAERTARIHAAIAYVSLWPQRQWPWDCSIS